MRLLSNHEQTSAAFEELYTQYANYEFAVAWAGNPNESKVAKLLKRNEKKIVKMVVGMHFYQTSPEFIRYYMKNPNVRFVTNDTSGVFHPKIYLFYNDKKDWSAIIGSSNFTYGGFCKNDEANVLIDSSDADSKMFKDMQSFIADAWNSAIRMNADDLKRYEECHRCQKKNQESLSKVHPTENSFDTSEMDVMNWDEYVSKMLHHGNYLDERMKLLNKAHEIFEQNKHFDDLDSAVKKCLAGFVSNMPGVDGVDWKLFGSMQGAGAYSHSINTNNIISKAIDKIPLHGEVTKEQFDDYCGAFKPWKNPLACATRLLCIKRPDVFVCIDSKNKDNLCKALNIRKNSLTIDTYWKQIVERMRESVWYIGDSGDSSDMAKEMKKYQVALLDALYYKNK